MDVVSWLIVLFIIVLAYRAGKKSMRDEIAGLEQKLENANRDVRLYSAQASYWKAEAFRAAQWANFNANARAHSQRPNGTAGQQQSRPTAKTWRSDLGLSEGSKPTRAEIDKAYRAKVMKAHPDHGGSIEKFLRVQKAKDAAYAEVRA